MQQPMVVHNVLPAHEMKRAQVAPQHDDHEAHNMLHDEDMFAGESIWDWITNTFLPSWETYDKLADFRHSDYVDEDCFIVCRVLMVCLLLVNLATTYFENPEGVYHFFFYFSYWGAFFSCIAITLSLRAAYFKGEYQAWACVFSEIAMTFSISITVLFWTLIFPPLFKKLTFESPKDIFDLWHYICTHTMPLIFMSLNIWLTRGQVFRPQDWKGMFLLSLTYMPFNYVGTKYDGFPMYPIADWKNFWFTVFCYSMLAVFNTGVYHYFSLWLLKKRPVPV